MSSSNGLWHIVGRVLAWVTLLFAVGTGGIQPLQVSIGQCEEAFFKTSAPGRTENKSTPKDKSDLVLLPD
jgi:hypothetical protein